MCRTRSEATFMRATHPTRSDVPERDRGLRSTHAAHATRVHDPPARRASFPPRDLPTRRTYTTHSGYRTTQATQLSHHRNPPTRPGSTTHPHDPRTHPTLHDACDSPIRPRDNAHPRDPPMGPIFWSHPHGPPSRLRYATHSHDLPLCANKHVFLVAPAAPFGGCLHACSPKGVLRVQKFSSPAAHQGFL